MSPLFTRIRNESPRRQRELARGLADYEGVDMAKDTTHQLALPLTVGKSTRQKSDDELTPRELYQRNWWRNKREYGRLRKAGWRARNLEQARAASRDWNRKNKGKLAVSNAKYAASLKGRWNCLVGTAKNRGHDLDMTFEQWCEIAQQDCVYCGVKALIKGSGYGIDRIDSSLGYTLENSAPCCGDCNSMKSDMSVTDFIQHARRIADFNR